MHVPTRHKPSCRLNHQHHQQHPRRRSQIPYPRTGLPLSSAARDPELHVVFCARHPPPPPTHPPSTGLPFLSTRPLAPPICRPSTSAFPRPPGWRAPALRHVALISLVPSALRARRDGVPFAERADRARREGQDQKGQTHHPLSVRRLPDSIPVIHRLAWPVADCCAIQRHCDQRRHCFPARHVGDPGAAYSPGGRRRPQGGGGRTPVYSLPADHSTTPPTALRRQRPRMEGIRQDIPG